VRQMRPDTSQTARLRGPGKQLCHNVNANVNDFRAASCDSRHREIASPSASSSAPSPRVRCASSHSPHTLSRSTPFRTWPRRVQPVGICIKLLQPCALPMSHACVNKRRASVRSRWTPLPCAYNAPRFEQPRPAPPSQACSYSWAALESRSALPAVVFVQGTQVTASIGAAALAGALEQLERSLGVRGYRVALQERNAQVVASDGVALLASVCERARVSAQSGRNGAPIIHRRHGAPAGEGCDAAGDGGSERVR
jgi:hypothetical protein